MMYYGYGPMYGWGWGGGVIMILFWVIFICFIAWIIRTAATGKHGYRHWSRNSALDILKERYAKGEIQKEEYEAKKKDLMD